MIIRVGDAGRSRAADDRSRQPCPFKNGAFTAMLKSMTHRSEAIGRRDVALAVVFSLLGLLLMYGNATDAEVDGSYLAIPAFLAVTIPVAWRRSGPVAVLGVTLAALVVHVVLFGEIVRCGVVFPLGFVLAFTAGLRLERGPALAGLGLALACVFAVTTADQNVSFDVLPIFWPLTAAVWGVGRVARSRGHLVSELQDRTAELRVARDERARIEVATDRARLSGELDELLHRRLHELAVMADAGAAGAHAESPTATLVEIEHESRRTLQEMRAVVGSLRSEDGAAAVAPQPTLTHLEALLVQAKGDNARLTVAGSPRILPAGVELSAYRVVEHLLDALDDAPGVDVEVRFRDDALELTVAGPARRRAEALSAIERARQRVELHRGTLRATTRSGRSEAVVQLPVVAGA